MLYEALALDPEEYTVSRALAEISDRLELMLLVAKLYEVRCQLLQVATIQDYTTRVLDFFLLEDRRKRSLESKNPGCIRAGVDAQTRPAERHLSPPP